MLVCKTQIDGQTSTSVYYSTLPKVPHSFVGTFTFLLTVYKLLVYFSINNEAMPQLVLDTSVNSEGGSWEEDWDKMVPGKVRIS